jgi:hypothetical protein
MRNQTIKNLNKLGRHLREKFGEEICETSGFINIAAKEAIKIDVKSSYQTIQKNEKHLVSAIKSGPKDLTSIFSEPAVEEKTLPAAYVVVGEFSEPEYEVEIEDEKQSAVKPVKIKVMMSDGSVQYFIPEPEVKPTAPKEEQKWTGLFDYKLDGSIVIRRGDHEGCVITKIEDVFAEFGSWKNVFGWIDYCLNPSVLDKLNFSPDTERDIKCLQSFKSFLTRKKDMLNSDGK